MNAESKQYDDPETSRYSLDEISVGGAATDRANPLCKELYLHDSEFEKIFGMGKEPFWKQPAWKQRDAKRKVGLF